MSGKPARVLIIAGSDSSGGAGIQADIKTAMALGCYAQTAITAVTAQSTRGVRAVHLVPPEIVVAQIEACLSDIGVDAIKIGMLGSAATVRAVARALEPFCRGPLPPLRHGRARPGHPEKHARRIPVVLDPVMVSTSGYSLLAANAVAAMTKELFPLAALVTPNIPEARALAHLKSTKRNDAEAAARKLIAFGAQAALIKGGHATKATVDDVLVWKGGVEVYAFPRIRTKHTHGTGCTLSTAIACGLAEGLSLPLATGRAREYVQRAIEAAPGLGKGHGPLNHVRVD